MKTTLVFAAGLGLGYFLGTENGRENIEKAKVWAKDSWESPNVQNTIKDVEDRVTKAVREQGTLITEKVTAAVKEATAKAKSAGSSDSE